MFCVWHVWFVPLHFLSLIIVNLSRCTYKSASSHHKSSCLQYVHTCVLLSLLNWLSLSQSRISRDFEWIPNMSFSFYPLPRFIIIKTIPRNCHLYVQLHISIPNSIFSLFPYCILRESRGYLFGWRKDEVCLYVWLKLLFQVSSARNLVSCFLKYTVMKAPWARCAFLFCNGNLYFKLCFYSHSQNNHTVRVLFSV